MVGWRQGREGRMGAREDEIMVAREGQRMGARKMKGWE